MPVFVRYKMKRPNAEKSGLNCFLFLIGAVIAYCLLWYVIPQNKGEELLHYWLLLFYCFLILLRFVIGKNKKM